MLILGYFQEIMPHKLFFCQIKKKKAYFAQSCPTLCDPTACTLPDFSVHGILQARILEWVAIPFSRNKYNQASNWKGDILCIDSKIPKIKVSAKMRP